MVEKLHMDITHTQHFVSKSCKLLNKHISENGGFKVLWKMKLKKMFSQTN